MPTAGHPAKANCSAVSLFGRTPALSLLVPDQGMAVPYEASHCQRPGDVSAARERITPRSATPSPGGFDGRAAPGADRNRTLPAGTCTLQRRHRRGVDSTGHGPPPTTQGGTGELITDMVMDMVTVVFMDKHHGD